jgi:RimJ/RimL family protein N-acetyltransferase
MTEFRIETQRLILREWREEDIEPLHSMSNDPRVMATLGPLMSHEDSLALIDRLVERQKDFGFTFWALELADNEAFIGFCGLVGGGEAAVATLNWGFSSLKENEIWAVTSSGNARSWGLMERLGMIRHPDLDFEHPGVPDGSPLKSHITYSIRSDEWLKTL